MIYYDLALVAYIFSFLLLLVNFYFNKPFLQRLQILFMIAAIILNMAQVVFRWSLARALPIYTLQDLLMLVSLSVGVIYVIFGVGRGKHYTGLFLIPVMILAGLGSLFLDTKGVHSHALESFWLYVHIPLAIVGTAFFLMAFASGIMYFILEKQLKEKKFGRIFERFPPLASIDALNRASLYMGFAFYTAGILAVLAWMRFRFHSSDLSLGSSFYVKILIACVAWVVTGAIILVKSIRAATARQTALLSVIGCASVLLIYLTVALFLLR